MKQITLSNRLVLSAALCSAFVLPVVAQAKPDHTANHIIKMDNKAAKMAGKQVHRDTTTRNDASKVVDALTLPEKKVFHGMSEAEKGVARHMAHLAKQIL